MPVDMKSIIADTFLHMVQHGNIDKITVKALIDACHISRQTFYYHFKDIMDVLEWSGHAAADRNEPEREGHEVGAARIRILYSGTFSYAQKAYGIPKAGADRADHDRWGGSLYAQCGKGEKSGRTR